MIKVLLAQFSLETHSRGIITVAQFLRDAGMEVIYIGNNTPQAIIESAVQEDVDVVGISSYCGGELVLGLELMAEAEKRGAEDKLFLIGGIFPSSENLQKLGFHTFPPGSTRQEIVNCIETILTIPNP